VLADDSLDELAEMAGWWVEGVSAVFRPAEAGWCARIDYRLVYGKHRKSWHMSLIDPRQRCREVSIRSRLADARRLAEGRVFTENRPSAA
jgi:hypothetical protein